MKASTIKEAYRLLRVAEYLESVAEKVDDSVQLTAPTVSSWSPASLKYLSISKEDAPYVRRALKAGVAALVEAAKKLGVEE